MESTRLTQVLAAIDRLNSDDPNQELVDGVRMPRELAYAQRLSEWLLRLTPDASEALRIAARGQHLRRWTIPRSRYPMNRAGYLRWRETLKTFHAQEVTRLMREVGYPESTIERVQTIMSKRQLVTDPETQALEDVLCLVFLETQFADLRKKTPEEKMREVVRKTWQKMSTPARAAARQLRLAEDEQRFLSAALGGGGGAE